MSSGLPATEDERSAVSSRQAVPDLFLVWQHGEVLPPVLALETGAALSVGREATCDIRLDSARVSRRHAEIGRDGSRVAVRDAQSRNGVFVNGQRVDFRWIVPGDVVRLGDGVAVLVSGSAGTVDWKLEDLGGGLMGGPELSARLEPVRCVAKSNLPVALVGATGAGKERVAHAIHLWSGRTGPFCAVNCAALPVSLAEAELFGYRKGAFTGAICSHEGHFRQATGGTLFLDEIADLALDVQAKLLRATEDQIIQALGDTRKHAVDVRLVVASQVPLHQLVKGGAFRQDLAERLSGITLQLPSLRDRKTEIVPLFRHFVRQHLGRVPDVEPLFVERLLLHQWAGNVRELDLLTRRLALVHQSLPRWQASVLPDHMRVLSSELPARTNPWVTGLRMERALKERTRQDRERDLLREALLVTRGNLSAAAAHVGISRQRAYRLLSADPHGQDLGAAVTTGLSARGQATGEDDIAR